MTFETYLEDVGSRSLATNDIVYRKGVFNLLTKYYSLEPEDLETIEKLVKKYCW